MKTILGWLFLTGVSFAQFPPNPRPAEWQADWYQVNWEREKFEKRIPTDTIYIHHTAGEPGHTWQRLSEIGHVRQYEMVYNLDPKVQFDPAVKGQVPYSGHFRMVNGVLTQVFYAYHWIVFEDGRIERLLDDREVGWHSGNWNENMRAIGIVLDGDLTKKPPSKKALKSAARLVAGYTKTFPITRLRGHYDNNTERRKTECPGSWFSAKDKRGHTGRDQLLKLAGMKLDRE